MCHRQVQCARHGCGHEEPIGDAKVDCQSSQCRYSAAHPRGCPICSSTCTQCMGRAQTIVVRNGNPMCSHCARQNA
ncbi:uncharacterized protein F5147DRAFT_710141 [Suillus discolor]|uniref:Uncharacterized protein n=1 Tax=Suillus discolor TaxID=1912936 RepID=A0A9P7F054_9AGAM|nr:uncharacterized protein F5147DRAFT_710141 [Suillus discolor]KAG2100698.1 hypothetical protein F5147DRAFT_710141 [Suillus discolor]